MLNCKYDDINAFIFTARNYAERGIATASHRSVCDIGLSWSQVGIL